MSKSKKEKLSEKTVFRVYKSHPTHITLCLELLKKNGWELAAIDGVINHYGNCEKQKIYEVLDFIPIERIDYLLNEMQEDGWIKNKND